MAPKGSRQEPHPHHPYWTALMSVSIGLAALLGLATGLAKPSVGKFYFYTYPTTIGAYICLGFALVGFIGMIRGSEFPLARKGTTEQEPHVSASVLSNGQLGHSKGLSHIYKYPEVPYDSQSDIEQALDAANSILRPPRPADQVPDFTEQWAERQRIFDSCSNKSEDPIAVNKWVQDVYEKLFTWSPAKALKFRPDSVPVSGPKFLERPLLSPAVSSLIGGMTIDESKRRLKEYGERLAAILDNDGA